MGCWAGQLVFVKWGKTEALFFPGTNNLSRGWWLNGTVDKKEEGKPASLLNSGLSPPPKYCKS